MHVRLRCAAVGLTLVTSAALISAGLAIAQTPPSDDSIRHARPPAHAVSQLQLTPEQRMTILNAVRQGTAKAPSPVNFAASPGASVPPSIELYMLPDSILAQLPETKSVKYTTVQNQIVLVDPLTMRVVEVLR